MGKQVLHTTLHCQNTATEYNSAFVILFNFITAPSDRNSNSGTSAMSERCASFLTTLYILTTNSMFDDFLRKKIKTSESVINLVQGGDGYPVLLLHGYPQTHACWHKVAPVLAKNFTVVCADLRGCGDSSKPANDASHLSYSKRRMAQDQVEVMQQLGFERFAVVGHDRGARVAHRMALDHRDSVSKLALLDIIPTATAFANVDKDIATNAFNWFFSIQKDDLPERLIGAEPLFYLHWCLNHWARTKNALSAEAVREYERCFTTDTIRATCEEFRAAATIDLVHDAEDKEHKIACPSLVLWSSESMWASFDILKEWMTKAVDVKGSPFNCGHFLPEEDAERTATELIQFLS
jgi:haloacetate dehalogenase